MCIKGHDYVEKVMKPLTGKCAMVSDTAKQTLIVKEKKKSVTFNCFEMSMSLSRGQQPFMTVSFIFYFSC